MNQIKTNLHSNELIDTYTTYQFYNQLLLFFFCDDHHLIFLHPGYYVTKQFNDCEFMACHQALHRYGRFQGSSPSFQAFFLQLLFELRHIFSAMISVAFVRWFTINIPVVTYVRNALQVTNQGPNPPAVLYLSDGGHIENLGILPLLKKRLQKIVSIDGGQTILDEDYGRILLEALNMARKKLDCSFSGMDGRDIAEDIREKFVERMPGSQPSSYRCVSKLSEMGMKRM